MCVSSIIYTTMHNLRKCSNILGVRRTSSETSKTTRPSNICKSTNNKKNTLEQPSPLNPSFKLGKNKKLFDSSWKDWRFRCRGLPIVGPRKVSVSDPGRCDVRTASLLPKGFWSHTKVFQKTKPPKIQKPFVYMGGAPQNGWFLHGKPYKNGWFGGTIIFGNIHMDFLFVCLNFSEAHSVCIWW